MTGDVIGDEPGRRRLVEALHAAPTMVVVAVTGGGNALITDLLGVPGASRTVLEIRVPYAPGALADLVGVEVVRAAGAVSEEMAAAMASACLQRATDLAPSDQVPVAGVAITAALASDRAKRGDHRAHIAIATREAAGEAAGEEVRLHHRFVALTKGELDRQGEDRLVADAALDAIGSTCFPQG
jgi:nicotinamide mononucleotide (NMN) deamidase PncC